MANIKQAKKRARQSEKHRANNKWQFTRMKSYIKRVLEAVEKGLKDVANKEYQTATSAIDKLASKGFIHKNKASRLKSRLAHRIAALS